MPVPFTPSHRGGNGPPLVLVHGITDTWRTWELVLPALERRHEVLAVTLAGHAGGPPLPDALSHATLADAVESAMDAAGFEIAHIAGNSLGGYVALQLAERGRARSVVALAPAGGWPVANAAQAQVMEYFTTLHELVRAAAPHADRIASTAEGRHRSTAYIAVNYEHIPADLVAHMIRGAASCDGLLELVDFARRADWQLDPERITCPVRIVWGVEDRLLPWPLAATRYREEWVVNADWVVIDGVGHSPQLDVPLQTAALIPAV